MRLEDTVSQIKGVGDKTSTLFHKIGVDTVEDLIHMYPRYYLSYDEPTDIGALEEGCRASVQATVASRVEVRRVRALTLVTCIVQDTTGSLKLTWFNMPYLRQTFHVGQTYVFVGEISRMGSLYVMEHPEFYTPEKYAELISERQPVYSLTAGLSNKTVCKAMRQALPLMETLPDPLPQTVLDTWDIMPFAEAVTEMHFPKSDATLKRASKRMVFEEFFYYLAAMEILKSRQSGEENQYPIPFTEETEAFLRGLPFTLTGAQKRTLEEIKADLVSAHPMNRLVQGDVGSGKTIVAVTAFMMAVKAGYQCAYMVPTEVLAYQHFESITKLLLPYGVRVELLVGSMTAKEKRKVYDRLANAETDLVIGTHALIQEKVQYKNLALVVTDEQHRFGVKQRQMLSEKGCYPHVMVMSATPIPRTLALILYGDLDISIMDELPANRIPIKNCVVGTNYRKTAYRFIEKEAANGHQIYVVCPMVCESESLEAENVISYTDTLKAALPASVRCDYIHGKMSAEEKRDIMQRFYRREIDVLVSTTVIEVGIDNPNATVMMIENAERFGLAQLHQLRGRVGRGESQSYCIFICGKESKEAMERLEVMSESNDGFFIANEDLRLRGPGDFFGYRQSGESFFELADVFRHADALKDAKDAVTALQKSGYALLSLTDSRFRRQVDLSMNL